MGGQVTGGEADRQWEGGGKSVDSPRQAIPDLSKLHRCKTHLILCICWYPDGKVAFEVDFQSESNVIRPHVECSPKFQANQAGR